MSKVRLSVTFESLIEAITSLNLQNKRYDKSDS